MAEIVLITDLVIGDVISFHTYGLNLVNNVLNGKLLAVESGDSLWMSEQAAVDHANIYSALPTTGVKPVADDFRSYNYLLIQLADNTKVEIGIPWIIPGSLTRLVRQTGTFSITDFDSSDTTKVLNWLATQGYQNVTISMS